MEAQKKMKAQQMEKEEKDQTGRAAKDQQGKLVVRILSRLQEMPSRWGFFSKYLFKEQTPAP